jgi:hypothetical protein
MLNAGREAISVINSAFIYCHPVYTGVGRRSLALWINDGGLDVFANRRTGFDFRRTGVGLLIFVIALIPDMGEEII